MAIGAVASVASAGGGGGVVEAREWAAAAALGDGAVAAARPVVWDEPRPPQGLKATGGSDQARSEHQRPSRRALCVYGV